MDIPSLWRLHDFFLDDFIASFEQPPSHITLDIDALDDPCPRPERRRDGDQQLVFFHGFYEQYQYLPLLITCAETQQIVWPTLRPGNVHSAPSRLRASLGADDDLRYVVRRLRQAWPDVSIPSRLRAGVVRGDAGFGVPCLRFEISNLRRGYPVDARRYYPLWFPPTRSRYRVGPVVAACSISRWKSSPRARELRRLKRKVYSSR